MGHITILYSIGGDRGRERGDRECICMRKRVCMRESEIVCVRESVCVYERRESNLSEVSLETSIGFDHDYECH